MRLGVEPEFFNPTMRDCSSTNSAYADGGVFGLIINPGALTHTGLALYDALAGSGLPTIEVHISNIYSRDHRQHSMTAEACIGVISGLGFDGHRHRASRSTRLKAWCITAS